jgi:repressor LexA
MLTHRQKEIHAFLRAYVQQHGVVPTYEAIRSHFGFRSYNAVFKHLKQLEARGYLSSRWENRKQAYCLQNPEVWSTSAVPLPLLGRVAAGKPIEALEDPDTVDVPESFLGSGEHFALRVRGNSMVEDGIHDGDLIIVREQARAENGQTVVALIDGEATVKRFHQKGDTVELRPANARLQPLKVDARKVTVRGVVVGLLRKYNGGA